MYLYIILIITNMKPFIIGLCGASCSGKSTVVEMIKKEINDITAFSMDNFYRGLEDNECIDSYNFDEPEALDIELFIDCISRLKKGENVHIPTYDFKSHKRQKETILIKPTKIIIIEGILIFSIEKILNLYDMKVFIHAKKSTVMFRRLERDIVERGRDFHSIKLQYINQVEPSYYKYIKPTKKYCDIVIPNEDNNEFIGVKFLCDNIKYKLLSK